MESSGRSEDERPTAALDRRRVPVDQLDMKILARLLVDGRVSFRQVAHELRTSTTTVSSRVSRLEKAGVISGYSAAVNFEALGYDLTAIVGIVVSKGKLSLTETEIAKLPGVCAVYDVTGDNDAFIVAKFRRREELSRFAKGLLGMQFVERANTHVVLSTVKEDFRLSL